MGLNRHVFPQIRDAVLNQFHRLLDENPIDRICKIDRDDRPSAPTLDLREASERSEFHWPRRASELAFSFPDVPLLHSLADEISDASVPFVDLFLAERVRAQRGRQGALHLGWQLG